MKKYFGVFKKVFFVFVFAYFLNFFWESLHAYTLYKDHDILASKYVPMMLYVSMIDAILITIIFIAGLIFFKKVLMLENYKELLFIAFWGFVFSSIIELKALFFNQWSYMDIMPTLFGIGLSPLIQLPITGLISIYLTKFF